jgi:alkylation response protein AidB-like acyl-CoA dehydrogenase
MDLTPSDEQRLLRESADRFVNETYTADHRRKVTSDPLGFSADIWKKFADLGWLALPIAEAHGGLGGGAVEIGILMEAFGRGLVSEPYLSTVVISASLIAECGTEAQKQALLPKIADGSLYLAFAHSERQARFDLADVRTTAKKTPDGWCLDGHKTAVLDGNAAGQLIVSALINRAGFACSWCRKARAASPRAITRDLAAGGPAISNSGMYRFLPTPFSATAVTCCRRSKP